MTTRYAVLLRGINVGGRAKLPMEDLRAMLEELGHHDVVTYIQSGNVALDVDRKVSDVKLASTIEAAITRTFSLDVAVVVRTHAELAGIVASNPLSEHEGEGAKLGVGFAPSKLPSDRITAVADSGDTFVVRGREVYLYAPNGFGRAKFPDFDRQSKVPVTVRNWNTVQKLLALTER